GADPQPDDASHRAGDESDRAHTAFLRGRWLRPVARRLCRARGAPPVVGHAGVRANSTIGSTVRRYRTEPRGLLHTPRITPKYTAIGDQSEPASSSHPGGPAPHTRGPAPHTRGPAP